jgi:hypothetical protein
VDHCCSGITRRALLRSALLAAGAWAVAPLTSQAAAAAEKAVKKGGSGLKAAEEALRSLIQRNATVKNDPWAMMHGVRALGKGFSLDEGPAIDYLCANFLKEKVVAGSRYLYMPKETEGHANTLLKTILEAGAGLDRPIIAAGRRRTVGDLLMSAKQRFSFDAGLDPLHASRDELAWSIIAFSMTTRPDQDVWKNGEGREIRLRDVVAAAFLTAERASADFRSAMTRGKMPGWKDRIANFTCGGTHLIYSLAVAVRYGHLKEDGRRRLAEQLDLLTWRLKADLHLADQYYRLVATAYPKAQSESLRHYELDARLKFLGHSMEIITYGRTFGLFTPTAAQQAEIRRATETLIETILDISTLDLGAVRDQTRPLYHLLVGDACHAYHGLWMARGVNQV